MSFRARSSHGCWTCRLRKKKCDEDHPTCSVCKSLSLACHGYGPRPDWLDGGSQEQEMATKIRGIVKKSNNQKRQARMQQHRLSLNKTKALNARDDLTAPVILSSHPVESYGDIGDIFPQTMSLSPSSIPSSYSDDRLSLMIPQPRTPSDEQGPPWDTELEADNAKVSSKPIYPVRADFRESTSDSSPSEDEQNLLMHYLDHVFPLQFRFYDPSISDGGRGWLLSILMRTKPLYHAALTLAAYHQQASLCPALAKTERCTLDELLGHHILAVRELRRYLNGFETGGRDKSISELIETLASIALLVSLEVFRGSTEHWQMHLQAASTVIRTLKTNNIELSSTTLSPVYKAAMHFFSSVIAWYDILSCATTGSKTFSDSDFLKARLGYIPLDKIMGCEDWVMLLIMDIALVDDWKKVSQTSGKLSMPQLVSRGAEIEKRLEDGLNYNSRTLQRLTKNAGPLDSSSLGCTPQYIRCVITRIFACAALVYLHVIVSGAYPELPEIRNSVRRTIAAFQDLPDQGLVRSLAWPFCIAGCMAIPTEEDFFRGVVLKTSAATRQFENSDKALKIIEECWRLRASNEHEIGTTCWMTAMKSLGLNILLV